MKKVMKRKLPLEKTIVKCLTVDRDDPRRGELVHVVGAGSLYPACPTTHEGLGG